MRDLKDTSGNAESLTPDGILLKYDDPKTKQHLTDSSVFRVYEACKIHDRLVGLEEENAGRAG